MMHNPEMNQAQPIPHIPPGVAKCTLDVRLSPDGSGQAQSAHSLWKAHAGVLWKIHEYFPISHVQMVGSGVRNCIIYYVPLCQCFLLEQRNTTYYFYTPMTQMCSFRS